MPSITKQKRLKLSSARTKKQKPGQTRIDKLIAGLTNIDNQLDVSFKRNSIDLTALSKLKTNAKPFWYSAELSKSTKVLHDIDKLKIKKLGYHHNRLPRDMKELLVHITDGFARGVSKYINENMRLEHKVSNGFVKLWEIYNTFDWLIPGKTAGSRLIPGKTAGSRLIPGKTAGSRLIPGKTAGSSSEINMFHMAEAPGQWINTTNTFFKKRMPATVKYNWYANSLNAEHPKIKASIGALKDDYGLIRKYKDRWIWGADNTGDITNPDNIRWYGEFVKSKYPGGVHVITGDGGLNVLETDLDLLQKLELAQMIMVAYTSTPGSCCIIKHFLPYLPGVQESVKASGFFMSFMYMYQLMFKEVHMFKPVSSSPGSGEFYVIGRGFLELPHAAKIILLDVLDDFKVNRPLFDRKDIPKWFVNKVCEFINDLTLRNAENLELSIPVQQCLLNKPSIINCKYYMNSDKNAGFTAAKKQDILTWLKKNKFNN